MFVRIGDVLPRFRIYEKLFPDHDRLRQALSKAYVDVLEFCRQAKLIFRKKSWPITVNTKLALKLTWKPFDRQFGDILDNFRNHQKSIEKEAGLSHMIEGAEARALEKANRMQLERDNQGMPLSKAFLVRLFRGKSLHRNVQTKDLPLRRVQRIIINTGP